MDHETIKNDAACQDKRFIYGSYMSLMNYIESFLVVIEDLNSELSPARLFSSNISTGMNLSFIELWSEFFNLKIR